MIKVGDRVRVITTRWGISQHLKEGTVMRVFPLDDGILPVRVDFHGVIPNNSYQPEDLEVISSRKSGFAKWIKGNV